MTMQTRAKRRKLECKLAFHVERRPHFLLLAIRGEASFDQAEVISAQLLRIPLDAYSLVVLDLAELTFLGLLAMGALVEYRRGLWRRGVEVRLANVQVQVWLALASAGLEELFEPIDLQEPTQPAESAGHSRGVNSAPKARTVEKNRRMVRGSGRVSGVSLRGEQDSRL
jgi:anti-anti-sigma factor